MNVGDAIEEARQKRAANHVGEASMKGDGETKEKGEGKAGIMSSIGTYEIRYHNHSQKFSLSSV